MNLRKGKYEMYASTPRSKFRLASYLLYGRTERQTDKLSGIYELS